MPGPTGLEETEASGCFQLFASVRRCQAAKLSWARKARERTREQEPPLPPLQAFCSGDHHRGVGIAVRARALRREELQSDPSAHAHAARALNGLRGRKSPRRTRRPQTGAFKEGRSEGSSARLLQEDPVAPDMSGALHRKPATCAEAFTKSTNSGGAFSALHLQTPSRDRSTSTAPRLQACHSSPPFDAGARQPSSLGGAGLGPGFDASGLGLRVWSLGLQGLLHTSCDRRAKKPCETVLAQERRGLVHPQDRVHRTTNPQTQQGGFAKCRMA